MKTLTPKQRARIYRAAAEYFSTADWFSDDIYGFCIYLRKYHSNLDINHFPEILLFENDAYATWLDTSYKGYEWFGMMIDLVATNHNQRIMCLLLAEQMALNPRFKL